ncbi:MAG: HTH domain-containing protein, partial [Pseudomonadota bacterium]
MKRADRLFATVLKIQSRGRVRAQDLAEYFGVTERTVYRDIASLIEVGIPIVSLPGGGYEMMPGFTMPPLMLQVEEASALLLSARFMEEQSGATLSRHLSAAVEKLQAVLPQQVQAASQDGTAAIRFYAKGEDLDLDGPTIDQIHRAIQERRLLSITYHSQSKDEVSKRQVEPV